MGREVKRVPVGFDWPLNRAWWGYLLDPIPCQACGGSGKASKPVVMGFEKASGEWHKYESEYCPVCEGEGEAYPQIEVPDGPGYQVWETTSEGSPISPAMESPEELAHWLEDNKVSAFAGMTLSFDGWLKFIVGEGWACTAYFNGKHLVSGVEFAIEDKTK